MKGDGKCRLLGDRENSVEIAPYDTSHASSYLFLQ